MEIDYVYYDTAPFGSTANTIHTLFQTANGADSTHTDSFTNMSGSGAFPQSEDFSVMWLGAAIDYNGIAADIQNTFIANVVTVEIANKQLLKIPLFMLATRSSFGGHFTQATAADEATIGLTGDGYTLRKALAIPKGTGFRILVSQVTALSTTGRNIKILMGGIRTIA